MKNTICIVGILLIFACSVVRGAEPSKGYNERELIAAVLVEEARGDGNQGMILVMNVIENRGKRNPASYAAVVLKPKQFSPLNKYQKNISPQDTWAIALFIVVAKKKKLSFKHALQIVDEAFNGGLIDQTYGADHFCRTDATPSWADPSKVTCKYRNHIFYRLGSHP